MLSYILMLIFAVLALSPFFKDLNLCRPQNVFLGSFFIYKFFGLADYLFGENFFEYTESEVNITLVLSISLVFGVLFMGLFNRNKLTKRKISVIVITPPEKNILTICFLLTSVGFALYFTFIILAYGGLNNMISLETRADLYSKKSGLGTFALGLNITYAGILLRLMYYHFFQTIVSRKSLFFYVLLLVILISIQFVNGDRGNVLSFVLPFIIFILFIKPTLNLKFLLFTPILIIGMQTISLTRASKEISNLQFITDEENLQYLNITQHGEFVAQQQIDVQILKDLNNIPLKYGTTFIDLIFNFLPKAISPNRAPLPAEWYVSKYNSEVYESGGGLGFSIISEALINFGMFGPLVYGLILGMLFNFLESKFYSNTTILNLVILCVSMYFIFYITRAGLVDILKTFLFSCIIPLQMLKIIFKNKTS